MDSTQKSLKSSIINYLRSYHALPFSEKIGIAIILNLALIAPFIESSGWDFLVPFRRAALSGIYDRSTWNPYPTFWLLYPFAILPGRVGFWFWNLLGAIGIITAIKYWNGRFLQFSLSLPCFWLFFIGQLEGVVAFGLLLSFLPSPWLSGLGIALLTIKPQIGLFPILFVIWHRRRDYRILIIPILIYSISFLQWGWWIPKWLVSIFSNNTPNFTTNLSLWPYSLVLLPLLWWKRDNLKIWLTVQSLIAPYFAVYSLVPLFTMQLTVWINVLLWMIYLLALVVPYPIPGFLIPIGILISNLLAEEKRSRVDL